VGNLKKLGGWLLFLLIAGASLSMAVHAWYQLATTGELPIHARRGSGTLEPFTFSYFVGAAFYALVFVIGVTAIIGLIDQYIPIAEKYRPRIRRILALLAAVSFVLPIAISVARVSTAN
jgi:UDP-N-acetylmuramyl pentapeptide phosphotransferase/UDP-N-acetylglucosamine-1-phosphate transferase